MFFEVNDMTHQECLNALRGRLIVSCQALEDEPLYSDFIMSRMACAAREGGAAGIRANTVKDIAAIRQAMNLPVIGLIKRVFPDSPVYITPTMEEIDALAKTGCEIIALDATCRPRPGGETLDALFAKARKKYPHQLFMADVSTRQEGVHAGEIGFDLVGTTLSGYTEESRGRTLPDFELMAALAGALSCPVIGEGGIWTPEQLRRAMDCGVHACVVGTAITRPREITRRFVRALEANA